MAVIGIDCDGVLASFEHGFAPLLTKTSGVKFPDVGKPEWPPMWDWDKGLGITNQHRNAAWDLVKANKTFWLDLPAHKDAFAFLNWLSLRHNDDIYFITHRMGLNAKWQTERWIKLHGFTATPTIVMTAEKGALCKAIKADFYIDDKLENCIDVRAQSPFTKCYVMERPYNGPVNGCPRGDLMGFRKLIEEAEK